MIELQILTGRSESGATVFGIKPDSISLGGADANRVDSIHVALPPAWAGHTVTAHFCPAYPNQAAPVAVVLDESGSIAVTSDITAAYAGGTLGFDATNGDSTAYTLGCRYKVYGHPPAQGMAPAPTPSAWEQFVAQVGADRQAAQAAQDAAEAALQALGSQIASGAFKGDTGPQGPKGDTGDAGPQGPKGDAGDTGPQVAVNTAAIGTLAGVYTATDSGNRITAKPDAVNGGKALALVLRGKTTQSGSGSASPTNIRPIRGVGCYDKCVVLDGNTYITRITSSDTSISYFNIGNIVDLAAENNPVKSSGYKTSAGTLWSNVLDKEIAGLSQILRIRDDAYTTEAAYKLHLAEKPLTIWYKSTAYATADTYYAVAAFEDSTGYHAQAVELDAPLFDDDSVDFVSGAVQHQMACARFTGNEAILLVDSNTHWAVIIARNANAAIAPGYNDGILAYSICNQRQMVTPGFSGAGKLGIGQWSGVLYGYFATSEFATADAVKAYLAAKYAAGTPVTVVYKLATPTVTRITPQTIPLENPTVITAENTLDCTYNKSIGAAIDELKTAIAALGTV